jgi:hypothetical protein
VVTTKLSKVRQYLAPTAKEPGRNVVDADTLVVGGLIFLAAGVIFSVLAFSATGGAPFILPSAMFVAAGVLLSNGVRIRSEKSDRAFKYLIEHGNQAALRSAAKNVTLFFRNNGTLDKNRAIELYVLRRYDADIAKVLDDLVLYINFLEEMAIGIKCGDIDERVLREFYCGIVIRMYDRIAGPLLEVMRNFPERIDGHPLGNAQRPDLFVNLVWLADRWRPFHMSHIPPLHGDHISKSWTG